MKKTYQTATAEIVALSGEDVITTSNQTPFAPYGMRDGE